MLFYNNEMLFQRRHFLDNFVPKTKDHWDEKTKIQAVQTFIKLGNSYHLTSKTLDIPRQTLIWWGKQDWWAALYDEFKQETNGEISGKLSRIIQRSLDIIEDRLENGDPFYDPRTGKFTRKEISIRDAHLIVKDNIYLQQAIEGNTTNSPDVASVTDKLAKLAKQFEDIANKKKEINVTDVVYIEDKTNAVYEERPQDGEDGS